MIERKLSLKGPRPQMKNMITTIMRCRMGKVPKRRRHRSCSMSKCHIVLMDSKRSYETIDIRRGMKHTILQITMTTTLHHRHRSRQRLSKRQRSRRWCTSYIKGAVGPKARQVAVPPHPLTQRLGQVKRMVVKITR